MKISPGDTLQIFLTVDGVPYAKTHVFTEELHKLVLGRRIDALGQELLYDIDRYADEPVPPTKKEPVGVPNEEWVSAFRIEVLKTAHRKLGKLVRQGDIGGNGWDQSAQRNGIVMALNELSRMIKGETEEAPHEG